MHRFQAVCGQGELVLPVFDRYDVPILEDLDFDLSPEKQYGLFASSQYRLHVNEGNPSDSWQYIGSIAADPYSYVHSHAAAAYPK